MKPCSAADMSVTAIPASIYTTRYTKGTPRTSTSASLARPMPLSRPQCLPTRVGSSSASRHEHGVEKWVQGEGVYQVSRQNSFRWGGRHNLAESTTHHHTLIGVRRWRMAAMRRIANPPRGDCGPYQFVL